MQHFLRSCALTCFIFVVLFYPLFAQDSLTFSNGNRIYGEIKSMDKNVLTIETPYSKNDFTIEWNKVARIRTTTRFTITLGNGDRVAGTLRSADSSYVFVYDDPAYTPRYKIDDIVIMRTVSKGFWDRIDANISLGYSITKAQNAQQLSLRSSVRYLEDRWSTDISYNSVVSTQDDAAYVQRKDGALNYNYFLPRDWYLPASVSLLSNTEQLLKLRALAKAGIGKYVIHSNSLYWGFSIGANYNDEQYLDDTPARRSWESFIGTELNAFDLGDLTLVTRAVAYPSLTESGRIRFDYSLDAKYDLPLDFYISVGVTVNYDNQPVEGGASTDYVCQSTFGWEW